jgi:hypothetical protein
MSAGSKSAKTNTETLISDKIWINTDSETAHFLSLVSTVFSKSAELVVIIN